MAIFAIYLFFCIHNLEAKDRKKIYMILIDKIFLFKSSLEFYNADVFEFHSFHCPK